MSADRMELAQQIMFLMDALLKENNMSLVVRKGKPVILDHELNKIYCMVREITGDAAVDEEINKHLVK